MAMIKLLLALRCVAPAGGNPTSGRTLPLLFSKEILAMFSPPHLTPVRAASIRQSTLRPASAGRSRTWIFHEGVQHIERLLEIHILHHPVGIPFEALPQLRPRPQPPANVPGYSSATR